MDHQNTLIWEVTFWEFLFVTVILAGGAAYMTGRAIANVWLGTAHIVVYMLLLSAATRFIHFSLFQGTLLSLHYYLVDLVVLLAIAALGFKVTRGKQMARQYRFLGAGSAT
jgi:hypothetical protein